MIKKLFIVLFVLILVVMIGLAIFFFTFEVDHYRPLVTKQLEAAIGQPVELGKISLAWRGGIAFRVDGLAIYGGGEKSGNPAIRLEEANALVELLPLFRKEVQIDSIQLVRPFVHLIRDAEGEVNVSGFEKPTPEAQPTPVPFGSSPEVPAPVSAPRAAAALPFIVDLLELKDGKVLFTDQTGKKPTEIPLEEIDLTLKSVSLTRPVEFQGRVALLSGRQNVRFNGRFFFDFEKGTMALEEGALETDLGDLEMGRLLEAFPKLKKQGLREGLAGELRFKLDTLQVGPGGVADLAGEISLSGGRIVLPELAGPLQNLAFETAFRKEKVELRSFSANLAGGTFSGSGTVTNWLAGRPQVTFQLRADQLALDQLVERKDPNEPYFQGILSAAFQGSAQANDWEGIPQGFSGHGKINVTEGVLMNLNVLREVFNKISVIPGLVEKLQSRLPESYQEKLNAKDTRFEPIELPLVVRDQFLYLQDFRVASEGFQILGSGRLSFDGTPEGITLLLADPDLSAAFIRSIHELQYLTTPRGELQIPLVISGRIPEVRILPDVPRIASLLAVAKTQEVVGGLIERKLLKKEPTTTAPSTQEPQPQDKLGFLGQLLEEALEGTTSQSSQTGK